MSNYDIISKAIADIENKKDPKEKAVLCRKVLMEAVVYLYSKQGYDIDDGSSLFELIDSDIVIDFAKDADVIKGLHYVRILGANAEHNLKIKKTESELSYKNLCYFVTLLGFLERGEKVKYQKLPYMSEANTRKLYIDLYLLEAGWQVLEVQNQVMPAYAGIEIKVEGMPNAQGIGFCDYVLYGSDGKPLAIVEAKKTSVDPKVGKYQVELYAECMEKVYGYKPVMYYTNGYETWIMDGRYPDRRVYGFHTLKELELMYQRRNLKSIPDKTVDKEIAGRPYQQIAVTNMLERFEAKQRRGLLVMATGTGKTRVSIALVDALMRQSNGWVKNVLFLADRTSLVSQAFDGFDANLKQFNYCVLSDKEKSKDLDARIIFSTYQTMINHIDGEKKTFTSGRFDLIIIDEAHRSIFNKYGAIFNYFDSLLVGLTATPKQEVDANTYKIFNCESGVPNFDYSLEEAVADKYLVSYKVNNKTTKVMSQGIKYEDLSAEDKRQIEGRFEVVGENFVVSENSIFKEVYNKDTCRKVLQDLMEKGLRVDGGETLGRSIIFAYNHKHAELITNCFNELYPEYGALGYCQLVDNQVKYADKLVRKFGRDENFRIAVSVDMLDTGIDVPSVLNLVFFKPVKSKIKFVQMIGRGTRLCPDIFGPGQDKKFFQIFDYCGNFEYFNQHPEGTSGTQNISLSQRLFELRLDILFELQRIEYQEQPQYRAYYLKLKEWLYDSVVKVKSHSERLSVREELQYVDKYYNYKVWDAISPMEANELKLHVSYLIDAGLEGSRLELAFDIHMLYIELSVLLKGDISRATRSVKTIRALAKLLLETKSSIPAVLKKAKQLKQLCSDQFWGSPNALDIDKLREEIRALVKYLDDLKYEPVFVDVYDVVEDKEDIEVPFVDVRTYREKVIDYLAEHSDNPVINKIKNLEQINSDDLKELEKILWEDLGNKEDYEATTKIDNLAAFVRSIVGIEQEAINEKFGSFLNGNALNSKQQEFVKAIINYVRENGDIERADLIEKAPFDNYSLLDLFGESVSSIVAMVNLLHGSIMPAA